MLYVVTNIRSSGTKFQKLKKSITVYNKILTKILCLHSMVVECATWRMHSTGPAWSLETQDDFFCRLASGSALTGLAIVHWIGCINTIKKSFFHKVSIFVDNHNWYCITYYIHFYLFFPHENLPSVLKSYFSF